MTLEKLEGTNGKPIEAEYINDASEFYKLEKAKAITTADSNGAINIWIDDDGKIRCNAMRHLSTIDYKITKSRTAARQWLIKWIEKIK